MSYQPRVRSAIWTTLVLLLVCLTSITGLAAPKSSDVLGDTDEQAQQTAKVATPSPTPPVGMSRATEKQPEQGRQYGQPGFVLDKVERGGQRIKVTWHFPPEAKRDPRITLTYPALNSSGHVAFLVTGREKQEILTRVRDGISTLPAAMVRPAGHLHWFTDRAAEPGGGD